MFKKFCLEALGLLYRYGISPALDAIAWGQRSWLAGLGLALLVTAGTAYLDLLLMAHNAYQGWAQTDATVARADTVHDAQNSQIEPAASVGDEQVDRKPVASDTSPGGTETSPSGAQGAEKWSAHWNTDSAGARARPDESQTSAYHEEGRIPTQNQQEPRTDVQGARSVIPPP
jgi:hypothetical protein